MCWCGGVVNSWEEKGHLINDGGVCRAATCLALVCYYGPAWQKILEEKNLSARSIVNCVVCS